MNNLIKATAVMAALFAVIGCVVISAEDSEAASTIYVGGEGANDFTGDGTETLPYATISKAISMVERGGTIELKDDLRVTAYVTINKDVTIDLNEKTITCHLGSGLYDFVVTSGSVTFSNGTISDTRTSSSLTSDLAVFNVLGEDTSISLDRITMNLALRDTSGLFKDGIRLTDGASATLNDTVIQESGTWDSTKGYTSAIYVAGPGEGGEDDPTILTITGNSKLVSSGQTINCLGNESGADDARYTLINISGNTQIESTRMIGIYHPQQGTLNISDNVSVKGPGGIEMRSGTLNIIGNPTIEATDSFSTRPSTDPDIGSGFTVGGAAVAVSQNGNDNPLSINIEGGTFKGAYALYETDLMGGETDNISLAIRGGTFEGTNPVSSQNVTDFIRGGSFPNVTGDTMSTYLADGFVLGTNGSVEEDPDAVFVAQIGEDKYTTLSAALADAQNGDTIELIAAVTETGSLVISSDVTIDLNGLSHSVSSFTVNVDTGLTIQDTVGNGALSTGGITVNGVFTLLSGTLKQIQVSSTFITSDGGTINLSGGMISGVSVSSSNAPVMIENGTLVMSATEISGCSGFFGAISAEGSTVSFTGGRITSNTSERGAMVYNPMVYLDDCQTTIENITISGNTQGYSMMAYWSKTGGSFSMSGGTLSDSVRTTLFFSTAEGANPTISISGGTIIGDPTAIWTEFADQVYIDLSGSPTIDGEFVIDNNDTASDAVFRLNVGFESADTVRIVFNSKPVDGYVPVAVVSGAESELEHVSIEFSGQTYFVVYRDGGVSMVRGVTLTFKTAIRGDELAEITVIPGGTIPYDEIKDRLVVEDRVGYYYRWVDSGTNKIIDLETYTVPDDGKYSRTIYPYYYLEVPEVSVSADKVEAIIGETITITASVANHSDALTYTYTWSVDGQSMADEMSATITVAESGAYSVVVTVADGKKMLSSEPSEAVSVTFTEAPVEPDPPFNPYPGDDDDYVPLPPTIVYEDDGSDSTASIAACAAAAVVAAILAIVLASTYRRK